MKTKNVLICICVVCAVAYASATDIFPPFSKAPFTVQVPTNTPGFIKDPVFQVGTNVLYTFNGQIFTNTSVGHIQTIGEGFSGTTDKSTPWKTLTELLAVYQQGVTSNSVRQLYNSESQSFITEIFTNADATARFYNFGRSITNMQVLMGLDLSNGFYVITSFGSSGNPSDNTPFFFVQTNGQYFLSFYTSGETNLSNIEVFLNTHSVTNLIPQ